MQHKESIAKATAWSMVIVGGFLFTLGFFSHDWWINSGTHTLFEQIVQEKRFTGLLRTQLDSDVVHTHGIATGTGFFGLPLYLGNYVLVALWIIPMWWWWFRKRHRLQMHPPDPGQLSLTQHALLTSQKWFIILVTIVLALTFIYFIPQRFAAQGAPVPQDAMVEHDDAVAHDDSVEHDDHAEDAMVKGVTDTEDEEHGHNDTDDDEHGHDEVAVTSELSGLDRILANRAIYLIVSIILMTLLTWGVLRITRARPANSAPEDKT